MFLLTILSAQAGPVSGGLQVALFDGGLDFIEDQLAGYTVDLYEPDLGGEYGCYDRIGVKDFNMEIPLREMALTPTPQGLEMVLEFDRISGDDMDLYSLDEDWFDACIEFDTTLEYFRLDNTVITMTLLPKVVGGVLELQVVGDPVVTGDLDTDINWFPDDLALAWFEESIFEYAGEAMKEQIPVLAAEYLGEELFGTEYGDFDIAVSMADANIDYDGLYLGAEPAVSWEGDDGCEGSRAGANNGRSPKLDFEPRESEVAFGMTEQMVNALFLSAWEDGYFCFTEQNIDGLLVLIEDLFDPDVIGLAATAEISQAPIIQINSQGIALTMQGMRMEITGELDGQHSQLLWVDGDIHAFVEPALDQDLASFTLDLQEMELVFNELESEHLLSDSAESGANLESFIKSYVSGWVAGQTDGFVLFDTLYSFYGVVLKVDHMDHQEGGLVISASLFDEDDPEVDREPPNGELEITELGADFAVLEFTGQDDRVGAIAYSYEINGGTPSRWSTDDYVRVEGLAPGDYNVALYTRDSWLNVDPSPAQDSFTIDAEFVPEPEELGCGCGSVAGGRGGLLGVLLLGLAVLRQRGRREPDPKAPSPTPAA